MTTPDFSAKLDTLPATLDLFGTYDPSPLALALTLGIGRHALAVGSGGSAIAAEYFARCRDTLGFGRTSVQTPMQVVLELDALVGSDVWLFSAGGDNPDVMAAAQAALDRHCTKLHLVTRNPNAAAAEIVGRGDGVVHVVPVANPKDGYLATHSLLAATTALLVASDQASGDPKGAEALLEGISARIATSRDPVTRSEMIELLGSIRRNDTMMVVGDPLLRPLSVLLDTSLWEASLLPVLTTDFRNWAHGRHAWLHHRAQETFVLALTGIESRATWSAIDTVLPSSIRRLSIDHGACGRLEIVLSLIYGLSLIEALGTVLGVDPGKPGTGEFGRSIYEDRSLVETAVRMPSNVRHKRAAMARSDSMNSDGVPLISIGLSRLETLSKADIGGAVFDYDGTIVSTKGRYEQPDAAIVSELVRLHRAGLAIGIATGRGGSVGEELRKLLPREITERILVGYYNGGHLRTADVNIEQDRAQPDPVIQEAAAWLLGRGDLFVRPEFKTGDVHIAVNRDALRHPDRFALDLTACPALAGGRVRLVGSGHSYDIVPAASSKLVVVQAMKANMRPGAEILCFGDSGSRNGNDHAFLAHAFGISVGEVCGLATGCWSLFGARPAGPEALLKLLRVLVPSGDGRIRLDVASLALDSR
ncbi:Hydroxymethylpyrimidine pyrophosphatase [uncultured Gammaproteobacteria bacterium]